MSSLDPELLQAFVRDGVVVIPDVLCSSEVREALEGFNRSLLEKGCDTAQLSSTASALKDLSSTHGSGGILDIFYEEWKLKLNEHPAVVRAIQSLWATTFANIDESSQGVYSHPFGPFDPYQGYMYIDRVCFRVPTPVSAIHGESKKKQLQRSLTPHLDCCPHNMYGKGTKWRPIQAFICLTDTLLPEQGGFEACPGHHRGFESWAALRVRGKNNEGAPCVGDFTPIRPVEDKDVLDRMTHIPCKAGDLVCWVSPCHPQLDSVDGSVLSVLPDTGLPDTSRKRTVQQLRASPRRGVHRDAAGGAHQPGLRGRAAAAVPRRSGAH